MLFECETQGRDLIEDHVLRGAMDLIDWRNRLLRDVMAGRTPKDEALSALRLRKDEINEAILICRRRRIQVLLEPMRSFMI